MLALVEAGLVDVLSFGLLPQKGGVDASTGLRQAIDSFCRGISPEAIGLTDAFGFTDWQLDR